MSDDIVTRLRGGDEKLPPATCWHCDEWGCENKHGEPVPCDCYDSCDCDNNCDCDCHSWRDIVARAADEIERLRELADNLYKTLQYYPCQCGLSKCKCGYDDMMDEYEEVRGE